MSELRFSYGLMSAGKSTLALQVEHTRDAVEVAPHTDLWALPGDTGAGGPRVGRETA